jgi:hypothetical protein
MRVGGRFAAQSKIIGCGDSKPEPASLARGCPRSFLSASVTARFGQDDSNAIADLSREDGQCDLVEKIGEGGFIDLEFLYVAMLFLRRFFVVAFESCLVSGANRLAFGASRLP